jgi:protein-S-isoprenylcysteine O-methyltransferase Ste14
MNTLKQIQSIVLLPGVVTVIIPGILISSGGAVDFGWALPSPFSFVPWAFGTCLLGLGLLLMFKTITLFAKIGKGTLAPWTPTRKLVIHGIYRHVRNPMISGVFCVLLGEANVLGSRPLLYWSFVFGLLNLIYIPLLEEPGLERRFGEAYVQYKKNVPRWLPRLHPWHSPEDDAAKQKD